MGNTGEKKKILGFFMGSSQYWAGRVYDLCVYFMAGTPKTQPKVVLWRSWELNLLMGNTGMCDHHCTLHMNDGISKINR